MTIDRKEFQILWCVEEGMRSPQSIFSFVDPDLDLSMREIERILEKLKERGLVKIKMAWDPEYKEDHWNVEITEKAKETYIQKAVSYIKWVPLQFI